MNLWNAAITREYSVLNLRHVLKLPHRFIARYVAISCIYIPILTCSVFLPLIYHMFSKLLLGVLMMWRCKRTFRISVNAS